MLNTVTAKWPGRLALLALCACSMAQAQNAPTRIGYVFTERLYTDSKLAKAADLKIEAEFSKRQKAIGEMIASLKKMSDKYDADQATLPDVERSRRTREMRDLEKDVERKNAEFREDLLQRKSEERAYIAQKAYKLIEKIAEQEKLDIVLQEAAWSSPRIDITDKILQQLDK